MKLPVECIESILDHLDETTCVRDLVSLLTVNKAFFQTSVRRLYSEPIKVVHTCGMGQNRAMRGLLALVLRYSPAQDTDVQLLRSSLSIELDALPEKPSVDYLSLIKTMLYYDFSFGAFSQLLDNLEDRTGMWLLSTLTWAACGHRLLEVRDIEISWSDLDRYYSHADDMTMMRWIRLRAANIPHEKYRDWSNDDKATIVRETQSVLCFMSKWSEAYAKLGDRQAPVEIELAIFGGKDEWWENEPFSQELKKIFERMPVSTLRELSTRNKLQWVKFCLLPERFDLSRVQSLVVVKKDGVSRGGGRWPKQGMASILQQCRSLRRFDLCLHSTVEDDLFSWAVGERRDAELSVKDRPQQNRLVPLSHLKLVLWDSVAWQNAIYAFGATLKSVSIQNQGSRIHVDLCAFHNMPELQYLDISTRFFDNSKHALSFSGCPKLEEISLRSDRPSSVERFDRWDLPQLKSLLLGGPICYHFDQASLRTMSHLEQLIFEDPGDLPFTWDMANWLHFPKLDYISLSGTTGQAFRWNMLDACPKAEKLYLTVAQTRTTAQAATEMDSLISIMATQSAMKILWITGLNIVRNTLFDHMPRVFPNLSYLRLVNCVDSADFGSIEQDMLKAKFPVLEMLRVLRMD